MTQRPRLLLVVTLLFGLAGTVRAEQPTSPDAAPSVTLAQNGADELYKDLEYVLNLTDANEQRQWRILEDYLDLFLIGIDREKPMRIDVLLGGGAVRYRPSFPVRNFPVFRRDNIETLGIELVPVRGTLYRCQEAFIGYMRYKHGYATFAENREEIPQTIADPGAAVAPLLKNYDVVLDATNTQTDSQAQEARRTSFRTLRDDWLSAVKKKKEESQDDFLLRKMLFEHDLEEAERLYVEAKKLSLGWVTDTEKEQGRLDLRMVPIEGTSLEQTVQMIGRQPSRFTGIPRRDGSILSLRLNYPLDEQRQENLLELFELLRTRRHHEIDAAEDRSDDEKAAARKAADLTHDLFAAIVKTGLADGFLEAHPAQSGKNTLIGGFRAVPEHGVTEILKALQQSEQGRKLELNVDTAGEVQIHKLTVSAEDHPNFDWFFGGEALYVGSGPETVWFAAGQGALAELKAAVEQSGGQKPADDDQGPFVDFFAKMRPWLELRQRRSPDQGDVELRTMALEAFQPGDDTWSLTLRRDEQHVAGELVAQPGILRLVGKMIAAFSQENLDTGQRAAN